ncbi:MAG: hypothetical protein N2Z80_06820 [Hydrogenothermaceae bacterium]|nr:hypothetical protein [Hydrogenothermaceae bacterium]
MRNILLAVILIVSYCTAQTCEGMYNVYSSCYDITTVMMVT